MRPANRLCMMAITLVLSSPHVIAQTENIYEVRGRVVDDKGRPVANMEVGTGWGFSGKSATPRWRSTRIARTSHALRTNAEGEFSGKLYAQRNTVALVALDLAKKRGGVFIFERKHLERECLLTIGPLVHLHGETGIQTPKLKGNTRYIYLSDTRARIAIASSLSKEDRFSFFMPPGEYGISFSAKDVEKIEMGVSLKREIPDVDLGRIELSPTNLARHYGKAPPAWHITEARGVRKDVKLSDYKGKWVMIEFWAYW